MLLSDLEANQSKRVLKKNKKETIWKKLEKRPSKSYLSMVKSSLGPCGQGSLLPKHLCGAMMKFCWMSWMKRQKKQLKTKKVKYVKVLDSLKLTKFKKKSMKCKNLKKRHG